MTTTERCAQATYRNEIERQCGYLKNDSLIRWSLGCSQAEIDEARAYLAKIRRNGSYEPTPAPRDKGFGDEFVRRQKAAVISNRNYLTALERAAK